MSKIAHILALRAKTLAIDLAFGVRPMTPDLLERILAAEAWIAPRPYLEGDATFLQIIPYVVVRDGSRVLSYRRGAASGETRLAGKDSIGLGGHVDVADVVVEDRTIVEKGETIPTGRIDIMRTVLVAACRELDEEAGIIITDKMLTDDPDILTWSHVIQADEQETDKVHIGLVATLHVERIGTLDPTHFESIIENAVFAEIADLAAGRTPSGDFMPETWTRLLLETMMAEEAVPA